MEVLLLVVVHFIPTIIAFCRGHESKLGVFAMINYKVEIND